MIGPIEFGRISDKRVGLNYQYGYAVSLDLAGEETSASQPGTIVKYDLAGDRSSIWDLGEGRDPGEFVFVERPGAGVEDDGWLLGYVYDRAEDRSSLVILDASQPGEDPIAEVLLPQRVPFGFHGSWIWD